MSKHYNELPDVESANAALQASGKLLDLWYAATDLAYDLGVVDDLAAFGKSQNVSDIDRLEISEREGLKAPDQCDRVGLPPNRNTKRSQPENAPSG